MVHTNKLKVKNFKSFDEEQELSMISSSKIRKHEDHKIKIKDVSLLKHGVIYGANASGKSNILKALWLIKALLSDGMTFKFSEDFCKNKAENKEKESLFELEFSVGDKFYAYGFSLILSQGKIIEEYLYELLEDGSSKNIFIRDFDSKVTLGDGIKLNQAELNRFKVYSEDFLDQKEELFLTYINNDKKFNEKSAFLVFKNVYDWLINNIIVIPNYEGFLNIDAYSDENSLEK